MDGWNHPETASNWVPLHIKQIYVAAYLYKVTYSISSHQTRLVKQSNVSIMKHHERIHEVVPSVDLILISLASNLTSCILSPKALAKQHS